MINFLLIFLLYSPVLFICFLFYLEDRYKIENIDLESRPFSLKPAIVLITLILSHNLIQSFWFKRPLFGHEYSEAGWELFVFMWNIGIFLSIVAVLKIIKISFQDIVNIRKNDINNMVKIGLVFICFIVLLSIVFGVEIMHDIQKDSLLALKSMSPAMLILFTVNTVVLIPIVEEIIFRGFLYFPLYRKIGRKASLLLVSYFFLHAHFIVLLQSIFGSLVVFGKGFFLTWLYDKKKTLIYPIGFHILFNIWSVYMQLLLIMSK